MNRFIPGFIKNADKKLLLTNPHSWSYRTHMVVWFSVLFMVVLALLGAGMFYDARISTRLLSLIHI